MIRSGDERMVMERKPLVGDLGAAYERLYHPPLLNLRWTAVLGGLAVGIAMNMFLLLIGAALGLAAFSAGASADERGLVIAASVWDTACMVIAAFIGGYIAARGSGMRRTPDGIMHGLLAWSAAMLIVIMLATSAAGGMVGTMFNNMFNPPVAEARPPEQVERQALVADLETRFGLTAEQANSIVDQIFTMSGRGVSEEPDSTQTLHTATVISTWIAAAVILSLLGAVGGGVLGSRATRRGGRGGGDVAAGLRERDAMAMADGADAGRVR